MKLAAPKLKSTLHSEHLSGRASTAGPDGIAITPPAYGVDAVDTQVIQAKVEPTRARKNNTGLPDKLKAGVETLSGLAMDEVKVHYNSPKPAQLQALAYTQGSDIHVGSGQERHLPHEAWHVVQQKQGRVKPTRVLAGLAVNDESALEQEASRMGKKIQSADLRTISVAPQNHKSDRFQSSRSMSRESSANLAPIQYFGFDNWKTIKEWFRRFKESNPASAHDGPLPEEGERRRWIARDLEKELNLSKTKDGEPNDEFDDKKFPLEADLINFLKTVSYEDFQVLKTKQSREVLGSKLVTAGEIYSTAKGIKPIRDLLGQTDVDKTNEDLGRYPEGYLKHLEPVHFKTYQTEKETNTKSNMAFYFTRFYRLRFADANQQSHLQIHSHWRWQRPPGNHVWKQHEYSHVADNKSSGERSKKIENLSLREKLKGSVDEKATDEEFHRKKAFDVLFANNIKRGSIQYSV